MGNNQEPVGNSKTHGRIKIAIHANELDGRGLGRVCRDYAVGLRSRGHEVCFITSNNGENAAIKHLADLGPVLRYDHPVKYTANDEIRYVLAKMVDANKIDFLHVLSHGANNGLVPDNCRTGVHCVFDMSQPHGTVYAGVSEYLCRKFQRPATDCVPHIVKTLSPTKNLRPQYSIPQDALVLGRHGGYAEFNIPFVHRAVETALKQRENLWLLFLSTKPFCDHPRAIFIPWVETEQEVANFIHTCDGMLHARAMGETFGLAVGEFSAAGKRVLTWQPQDSTSLYDAAHLEYLGNAAITYSSYEELLNILLHLEAYGVGLDRYSQRFSERFVMDAYERVFLNAASEVAEKQVTASIRPGDYLNDIFDKHDSDKGRSRHRYGRIYEHLLAPYKDRAIKLLEIGVYAGGSIKAWLEYLPLAHIVGVDLRAGFRPADSRAQVVLGDQGDPDFLKALASEHGPFDVIVDDGSHQSEHQQLSFEHLYPYLRSGGVYVVEDLEVAYVPEYLTNRTPTTEYFKALATSSSVKVGGSDYWIMFAGELVAIFKK